VQAGLELIHQMPAAAWIGCNHGLRYDGSKQIGDGDSDLGATEVD
jgi:hypothetical protein